MTPRRALAAEHRPDSARARPRRREHDELRTHEHADAENSLRRGRPLTSGRTGHVVRSDGRRRHEERPGDAFGHQRRRVKHERRLERNEEPGREGGAPLRRGRRERVRRERRERAEGGVDQHRDADVRPEQRVAETDQRGIADGIVSSVRHGAVGPEPGVAEPRWRCATRLHGKTCRRPRAESGPPRRRPQASRAASATPTTRSASRRRSLPRTFTETVREGRLRAGPGRPHRRASRRRSCTSLRCARRETRRRPESRRRRPCRAPPRCARSPRARTDDALRSVTLDSTVRA